MGFHRIDGDIQKLWHPKKEASLAKSNTYWACTQECCQDHSNQRSKSCYLFSELWKVLVSQNYTKRKKSTFKEVHLIAWWWKLHVVSHFQNQSSTEWCLKWIVNKNHRYTCAKHISETNLQPPWVQEPLGMCWEPSPVPKTKTWVICINVITRAN